MPRSVKVFFVGPQDTNLNQDKFIQILKNSRLFDIWKNYDTILEIQDDEGVLSDETIFFGADMEPEADHILFVTSLALSGNYFFRVNKFGLDNMGLGQSGKIKTVITTYDTDYIAKITNISLERALAFLAIKSLFVGYFLDAGGTHSELYTSNVEQSAFGFARNKLNATYNLRNPKLNDRVREVIRRNLYSEQFIKDLDHDLHLAKPSGMERIFAIARNNQIATSAIISFLIALFFFILSLMIQS